MDSSKVDQSVKIKEDHLKLIYCTLVTLTSLLSLSACSPDSSKSNQSELELNLLKNSEKVIYGEDDRLNVVNASQRWKDIAKSTVALVKSSQISLSGSEYSLPRSTYGQSMGLCSSEPFFSEPNAAFCSGSLVAPNLIITAGHCVRSATDCSSTKFVFDYAIFQPGIFPFSARTENVYSCAEIVAREEESSGADYALIRLDRNVLGRQPLKIRRNGEASAGTALTVIGHPSGLPTKIASGGKVRSVNSKFYVTNLDTYGGNSGSAVFNSLSGEIEGILVRGENDFVNQGSCTVSNRCTEDSCRGEDVTKISVLASRIPANDNPTDPVDPTDPVEPVTEDVFSSQPGALSIPDRNRIGIVSSINTNKAPQGKKVLVEVNISHTYVGDLTLTLQAPNGIRLTLIKNKLGRTRDLIGVFGESLQSEGNLALLSSVNVSGVWRLRVVDSQAQDVGVLNSWKLKFK